MRSISMDTLTNFVFSNQFFSFIKKPGNLYLLSQVCSCPPGYQGDPYTGCNADPCSQSPCGINAECSKNGNALTRALLASSFLPVSFFSFNAFSYTSKEKLIPTCYLKKANFKFRNCLPVSSFLLSHKHTVQKNTYFNAKYAFFFNTLIIDCN
jgi:hypothetical protein